MGKKCIQIKMEKKPRMIYCEDLQKIYYLKKKKIPKLPTYETLEDEFTLSMLHGTESPFTSEQMNARPKTTTYSSNWFYISSIFHNSSTSLDLFFIIDILATFLTQLHAKYRSFLKPFTLLMIFLPYYKEYAEKIKVFSRKGPL